jgi:para-nitrobenzyl esterase
LEWVSLAKTTPTASVYKEFLRSNFGNAASLVGKNYLPSLFEPEAKLIIEASSVFADMNSTALAIVLAMTQVITDSTYKCPAWYGAAQATRKGIPAWTYQFTHGSTCPWLFSINNTTVSLFNASHTAEIPFVFGNLDNSYLPAGDCNSTAAEWKLGGQMMDLWTAMAAMASHQLMRLSGPSSRIKGRILRFPV